MTIHRIDRWNIEVASDGSSLLLPVEASADGSILSVFLERIPTTQENRDRIRREVERNYAGSRIQLEFDPER